MEKRKKQFGDKKDAYLVRDLGPMHNIMNNLMGERTENEAIVHIEVELDKINAYLNEKNKNTEDHSQRYTLFHAILAAFAVTLNNRRKMNFFVRNKKYFERKEITFSYIAKKEKSDGGFESVIIQRYKTESEKSPLRQMHDKTCKEVGEMRKNEDSGSGTDKAIQGFLKLPSPILKLFFVVLRFLDKHGWVPSVLHKLIPYYSTVFVANLGSIGFSCDYHHLINFGTNSIFIVIGEKYKKHFFNDDGTFSRISEILPICLTIDERIADGVYYANTIKMIKYLMDNPELLDIPANQKIDFPDFNRRSRQ